jgi:hypothetical protein
MMVVKEECHGQTQGDVIMGSWLGWRLKERPWRVVNGTVILEAAGCGCVDV